MQIECPSCSAPLKARAEHIGRKVRCPKCSEVITITDPDERVELDEFLEPDDDSPAATGGRLCPMCGAHNSYRVVACTKCGEELGGGIVDGNQKVRRGVWRDGNRLVMHQDAKLPERCVKTNGPADRWLRRKLYWHHPAVYLSICGGLLIYVILALVLRKQADIRVGLCDAAYRKRITAMIVGWVVGLGSFGIVFAGIASSTPQDAGLAPILIPLGLMAGVVGVIVSVMIANCVSPTRITDKYVWLRGVHRDYLAELPEWPGEE